MQLKQEEPVAVFHKAAGPEEARPAQLKEEEEVVVEEVVAAVVRFHTHHTDAVLLFHTQHTSAPCFFCGAKTSNHIPCDNLEWPCGVESAID